MEYIEEVYGALEEELTAKEKVLDRAWSYLGSKNYLAQCSTMRSWDKNTLLERTVKLGKLFSKIEEQLGEGPYFKGVVLIN